MISAERTEPVALGATVTETGVAFGVYSETAEAIWVCLFDERDRETDRIALEKGAGHIWSALVPGLAAGARYGLRADGPFDPGQGYYFDPNKLLVDPYARQIDRRFVLRPELRLWREDSVDTAALVPKAIVWASQTAPAARSESGRPHLIYELNVRSHTMVHPSVPEPMRGTVDGLTHPDVIGHIKSLGVDVVELMPVAGWIDDGHLPALGLTNVWGYNPVTYFAPDPRLLPHGPDSLRRMVQAYGAAGIGVVLDVVYNHTGESDIYGPIISMKGLDARTYYRHFETGDGLRLANDAGTGNTLQCDHPAVQDLVVDSLRHWVTEYGIGGFRFDLAPILGRTHEGFSADAALLGRIRSDDVLKTCLLIAEPWDPGPDGYHVGRFGEPFSEWNDRYRDDIRKFWRGDHHAIGSLADRLAGSADLFNHHGRKPSAGINFLAAHDGFTLADLVSHSEKNNGANGEHNRDGHDGNYSWNNGAEGETDDAGIELARRNDVRALLATLFVSHGSLMLTAGDEIGRSQGGNNNAYAQDNAITWLDWDRADHGLSSYVSQLSAMRRGHPAFISDRFLDGTLNGQFKDVSWLRADGREMEPADWHVADASVLGMFLHEAGEVLLVWFNRSRQTVAAALPQETGLELGVALASPIDARVRVVDGAVDLPPRSVVIMTAH